MRIAIAQLDFTVGAFTANLEKIARTVARARAERADLCVFSELATTGYPPRDLLERNDFLAKNLAMLDRVAALATDLGIIIGFVDRTPRHDGRSLRNAVALCVDGKVVACRYKSLLPTYDVFDEDRYFEPATEVEPVSFRGVSLGLSICEDAWNDREFWPERRYDRNPIHELVDKGAELLINISASPFSRGKRGLRCRMIQQQAVRHERHFLCVNQVGGQDELVFDGTSVGFGPNGGKLFQAEDFAEDFLVAEIPEAGLCQAAPAAAGPIREGSQSELEEVYRALVLGVADYTRKCGFDEVVIGLSGGIDSALTAVIAADALGPDRVLGVSMPSRYSSAHSKTDAAELANNLGITFRTIEIDPVFASLLTQLEPCFAGRAPDVTEENLQARVRGAVLMALSNKLGSLVLTTGNKSELAVGYCTLYGDMCGGLAVISDVPKTLVFELARFVNRDGVRIPISTIEKPPSAELRPDQKDEDSLPPYQILDRILELYIEGAESRDELVAAGLDPATVAEVTCLVDRNEYKRRQAAPGIKITSKAFGVGRRYPVTADYRAIAQSPKPRP